MDTIFMNSENSKTSEYNVLLLKLVDKLDLRGDQKSVALSDLSIYYTWRNIKSSTIINLKYLLRHGVMNLNYQMDHVQYQIFKIIESSESVDDPPIEIFISKSENRITFKIKNLEVLKVK